MRLAILLLLAQTASAADLPERFLADFAAATGQSALLDAGVPAPPAPAAGAALPGKLVLSYSAGRTGQAKKWERILKESKLLETAVAQANARYALPYDLAVEARQCGEANAWYKAEERKIIICYEEPAATAKLLKDAVKPKNKADALALGDLTHTFWHEHSLDKQRYYDILCLIYGKDPDKYADLVPKKLPQERADNCPAEYEHLDAAWQTLLAPHLKPASSPAA